MLLDLSLPGVINLDMAMMPWHQRPFILEQPTLISTLIRLCQTPYQSSRSKEILAVIFLVILKLLSLLEHLRMISMCLWSINMPQQAEHPPLPHSSHEVIVCSTRSMEIPLICGQLVEQRIYILVILAHFKLISLTIWQIPVILS